MSPQELFKIWAPADSIWSPWAKPVLFSFMFKADRPAGLGDIQKKVGWPWLPPLNPERALVIDLPGAQAVALAIICARVGYRPVPLFNACEGPSPVLDQNELQECLFDATADLSLVSLTPQSPPVFILDSRRMDGIPVPRRFDNRWMVFPQDFPSARFLKNHGINKVCLIQNGDKSPADDLAHILVGWQQQGLEILWDNVQDQVTPQPLQVRSPSLFKSILHRMMALAGLKKNSAGGFGMMVPEPSSSSGYG